MSKELPPMDKPKKAHPPMPSKGRILVIEDDYASRTALVAILTRLGWSVGGVSTIAEAHAALQHAQPDCIVLDIMLPDGDGAAILHMIRERKLPIRVAVVTGLHDPDRLAGINALQPEALLRKPIDISELVRKLGLGSC